MTEQAAVAFFVAHPFFRSELLLMVGAVSGFAKKDWEAFKSFKVGDPLATFKWRVAAWEYLQGALIGGVPPLVAIAYRVLGG
jgi:hypothetical protein